MRQAGNATWIVGSHHEHSRARRSRDLCVRVGMEVEARE